MLRYPVVEFLLYRQKELSVIAPAERARPGRTCQFLVDSPIVPQLGIQRSHKEFPEFPLVVTCWRVLGSQRVG